MATLTSHSPEETFALGEQWGREAQPGWVIGLTGNLGAGKTCLVKGLASGLGIQAPIQSPTFALVNEYPDGRLPLAHLDLYRLDTPAQIIGAGLDIYFDRPPGVVVVEWCERWPGFHPLPRPSPGTRMRFVRITETDEISRQIEYEDAGV